MRSKSVSIPKYADSVNEDAVGCNDKFLVVSDGAGGGGVYADRWARYLTDHLPPAPITSFEALDKWVDGICDPFYQACEEEAKREGGLLLSKFYNEGSFATLAAVWMDREHTCSWMTYGDSVAFCYHRDSESLEHSFGKLEDFNRPPYLVSLIDPLKAEGFRQGTFELTGESVVFVASDALSHYILMMSEVAHKERFMEELQAAMDSHSRNGDAVKTAMAMKRVDFEKDVLGKLLHCVRHKTNMQRHIDALKRKGLLMEDDYSLAMSF